MIKVLWFSPNVAAGDEISGSNGTGGWMKALDKAIQDKVELHVAFYDRRYPTIFKVGKTTYHSLAPIGKWNLIKRRLKLKIGKNPDLQTWKSLIDEVNPDLIHIHGVEKGYIQVVSITDRPVVLSIQAILTSMTHKFFGDFEKKDLGVFYRLTGCYKEYKRYCRLAAIEKINLLKLKFVIGRTDWDRRVYSVLAPNARYFKNNEVLREGFYNNTWKEHMPISGKWVIHTTTGGLLFKGLETICMALNVLQRSGMNVEWRVAGIGENDDIVKITKRRLKDLYPQSGIKYLGRLSEKELIDSMLDAHLFAYPTHQDNSSNALCEAMMLGMPCVSTFAGGSGTMLTDKVDGLMVQDGEPWAMAGAIKELLSDRTTAVKYASVARTNAANRHSRTEVSADLLNIYKEVVKADINI